MTKAELEERVSELEAVIEQQNDIILTYIELDEETNKGLEDLNTKLNLCRQILEL